MKRLLIFSFTLTCITQTQATFAFENTKLMPKGVRNLGIRMLSTQTSKKTNENGDVEPLAEPLWKPLRFRNVISGETGFKKKQLEALLLQQGWDKEKTLGDFKAELNAKINVTAPIFAVGATDRLTLIAALPVYNASTDIQAGFTANEGASEFIAALRNPLMNQNKSAIEASQKLQNAIGRLNDKLVDNNYEPLKKWNSTDIGDLTLMGKYLIYDGGFLRSTGTFGLVAPTGTTETPEILTDLSFGDGQWDVFSQLTFDQRLAQGITFNQFYKYTYQAQGEREFRLKTDYESIEVDQENLTFKLGDKVEAGASLQFEQDATGIVAGLGATYFLKYGDRYDTIDYAAQQELQKETDRMASYWSARLGYSSIPAFKRKEFAIPLMATIEYRKQYKSRNHPMTDFTQIDVGLFF